MRKISFILTIAMLVMAVIIIPVGISNIFLALHFGLIFECVSSLFLLCLFIAFSLFEVRELLYDMYVVSEENVEQSESGGEHHETLSDS